MTTLEFLKSAALWDLIRARYGTTKGYSVIHTTPCAINSDMARTYEIRHNGIVVGSLTIA